MTKPIFTNNGETVTAEPISDTETAWTLEDGTVFDAPGTGEHLLLTIEERTDASEYEVVKCTDITGDVVTVVRGQEGTSGTAFTSGSKVEARLTKGGLEARLESTAIRTGVSANTTFIVPSGYMLTHCIIKETGSGGVTLKFGTTDGGTELLSAMDIVADGLHKISFNEYFSDSAATTVYVQDTGGGWGSAALKITALLKNIEG